MATDSSRAKNSRTAYAINYGLLQGGKRYALANLYETRDRGQRWKWLSGGDNVGEVAYEYLGEARDGAMVAFGLKSGAITALISTDIGTTWQPNN